jgi:hypothetical protein
VGPINQVRGNPKSITKERVGDGMRDGQIQFFFRRRERVDGGSKMSKIEEEHKKKITKW